MAPSRPNIQQKQRARRRSARKVKTKVESYHAHLRPLMAHIHERAFSTTHEFTREELMVVTPAKIMNYLKIKIYDDANADPDTVPPKNYRSNSIKSWKKAWSYFMPNKLMTWDEVAERGNPTRCAQINSLIGSMIKMEVSRRGKPSCARRAFTTDEYQTIMVKLGCDNEKILGALLGAYFSFQVSMIARLDDTAKFRKADLQPFHAYPEFGVTAKLCWAKNCREERDAPTQVIFGAGDWRYCVLSLLGVWLESNYESLELRVSEFVFDALGVECPVAIKDSVADHLRDLLRSGDVQAVAVMVVGLLGTHSLRKYGTTIARGNGCSKDDTDLRGRWKSDKRQQDTYADTTIPYVDGKVAASLCRGGPIAYLPKDGSGVTDEWIRDHVARNMIAGGIPPQVCTVLGRAMLWKVFEASASEDTGAHCIPPELGERVLSAYRDLGERCTLESEVNPISKLPLGVTGVDAQLIVDVITCNIDRSGGSSGGPSGGDWRAAAGLERQEVRLLSSQVQHLRREFSDMREEMNRGSRANRASFGRLSRSINRIAASPAMRLVRAPEEDPPESPAAAPVLVPVLSSRPKLIHDLWQEYMFGGAGRKAAKDFTPSERGACKHVYTMRKPLWEKVSELVRHGVSANVACDKVYEAYGRNLPVTTILRKMKRDRRSGDWPEVLMVRAE